MFITWFLLRVLGCPPMQSKEFYICKLPQSTMICSHCSFQHCPYAAKMVSQTNLYVSTFAKIRHLYDFSTLCIYIHSLQENRLSQFNTILCFSPPASSGPFSQPNTRLTLCILFHIRQYHHPGMHLSTLFFSPTGVSSGWPQFDLLLFKMTPIIESWTAE